MPHPLDEFPLHQAALPLTQVATSDRNAYDRCYFNAHDRSGGVFLVTGLGVYPNLGVIDAYATVRRGSRQVTVRASDALGDETDRLRPSVGPFRVEVVEPLQHVRVTCDAADLGLAFDLTWTGSFPALDQPPHLWRQRGRVVLGAHRFAQVGTWEGSIAVDGETLAVDPARWVGTRDRSWGIRPVGEPEPPGRGADEPLDGFWWLYVPLRFDDFAFEVMVQEEPDGTRVLNEAVRVWPARSGRAVEQLGWPEVDVRYRPGTRDPAGATLRVRTPARETLEVEVESLTWVALNCGPGYGGDPEWSHGQWRGRGWVERADHDLTDPAVLGRVPFGVVDHVGRARCDGAEGWGLFEHATFGRHAPSGFADWSSVAS